MKTIHLKYTKSLLQLCTSTLKSVYFCTLLSFILSGCSHKKSDISDIVNSCFPLQDTTTYQDLIKSNHTEIRKYLNSQIDLLVSYKISNDTSNFKRIDWLIRNYSTIAGINDLHKRYNYYKELDSKKAIHKNDLDKRLRKIIAEKVDTKNQLDELFTLNEEYTNILDSFHIASTLFYIGECYNKIQNLDSAFIYYDNSLIISRSFNQYSQIVNCLIKKAHLMSSIKANYFDAELLLMEADKYAEIISENRHYIYAARGYNFYELGQIDKAITYAQRGLQYKTLTLNYLNYLISECYIDQKQFDSAQFYLEEYIDNLDAENSIELGYAQSGLALIHQDQNETSEALSHFQNARNYFMQADDTLGYFTNQSRLAYYYLVQRDYLKAESLFSENISLSQKTETTLESLFGLASAKYYLGEFNDSKIYLKNCIQLFDLLEGEINLDKMLTNLMVHRIDYYDLLISIYLDEYSQSGLHIYIDSALFYYESKKSNYLNKSLQNNHTQISQLEKELIDNISFLRASLLFSQEEDQRYKDSLHFLEEKLYEMHLSNLDDLELFHDEYDVKTPLAELLTQNDLFVQYQLSSFGNYIYVINKSKVEIVKIDIQYNILSTMINEYFSLISHQPKTKVDLENYKKLGNELYKLLILPIEENNDANHLYVVPSKTLYQLPLESLINNKNNFIAEQFSFSYLPSISSFQILKKRSSLRYSHTYKLLAVGDPVIPENVVFQNLSHTDKELEAVKELFREDVTILKNEKATELNFKQEHFEQYDILHIASHSYCNVKDNTKSAIIFSPERDSDPPGSLFPDEIEQLSIPCRLVFLSACQTAAGQLLPGEGVMSLSKPFMSAGTNAVIASAWSVDDFATSEYVKNFYSALHNRYSINNSLMYAQKHMIHSNRPLLRHPYYWAAFTMTGIEQ